MKNKASLVITIALFLCFQNQSLAQKSSVEKNGNPNLNKTSQPKTLEDEVIAELNSARENPKKFAGYLKDLRKYYRKNEFAQPNKPVMMTNEGVVPCDEAIAFLENLQPLNKLKSQKGLKSAANDHLKDLQNSNKRGHIGSDNSAPEKRIERYGQTNNSISEIISYNETDPRHIVLNFLIDDGTASRGHRKKMLDAETKLFGISCGKTQKFDDVCVIVLAEDFTENPRR